MRETKPSSLTIQAEEKEQQNNLLWLPACVLVLTGAFGILFQEWRLAECGAALLPVLAVGLAICGILLLTDQLKKGYSLSLLLIGAVTALAILLFQQQFKDSVGTLLNQLCQWSFLRKGIYVRAFEAEGSVWPTLLLLAVFAGICTQILVKSLGGRLLLPAACIYVFLLIFGAVRFNGYGLALLTGCALALVAGAEGQARAFLGACAAFVLIGGAVLGCCLLFRIRGPEGKAGEWLDGRIHTAKYEKTAQAMPEGKLKNLGAFSPEDSPALQITADYWRTLYFRGFQGGTYTGDAWKALTPEELEEEKDLLCSLQKEGFYAASQLAEGWKALGKEAEEQISVTNTGACEAWQYIPYGADAGSLLDPVSIVREGTVDQADDASVYGIFPVEDSYYLMKELSDAEDEDRCREYREKEHAYRSFVKEHYLDIPDRVQLLLEQHKLKGSDGISTAQACKEVKLLLKETMKYNEATASAGVPGDFLEYLLNGNPAGYSVHYATLAVMMLRSYGIPARYVEGYYIPASETENLSGGESYIATQKNSSAWVEYYVDGVGWLVFDPVPAHTETITYRMPVGEGDTDLQTGNMGLSDQNKKNREQEEEEEEDSSGTSEAQPSAFRGVYAFLILLGILLLLAVLAMILRTVILRRRMARRRARFHDPDPGIGTAVILCVLRELVTGSLKIPEEAFFENPDGMVTELLELSEEELAGWKRIADEIQFSCHATAEETRDHAEKLLQAAEDSWKAGVRLPRRFWQKYILCRVW